MTAPELDAADPLAEHDSTIARRAAAILRLLLLPAVTVASHASAQHHSLRSFDIVVGLALLYSGVVALRTWNRSGTTLPLFVLHLIDLGFVSALAVTAGPSLPQMRAAFTVAPLIAALRATPSRTALLSAVSAASYVAIAALDPLFVHTSVVRVLAHSLFIVWAGGAAVTLSLIRVRREERIAQLSHARGLLVAQVVDAEERVRRQLSSVLHDNVIQDLLVARQDLIEARAGDPEGLSRVDHALDLALCQLRNTIEDLNPYVLDHLGLAAALEMIAERAARHGDCTITVAGASAVAPGPHVDLLVSLSRELLTNAAKHADGTRVELVLSARGSSVVLTVTDDGRGFAPVEAIEALRQGHIGLAAARERVEAVGGRFTVESKLGRGTRVTCVIPVLAEAASGPERSAAAPARARGTALSPPAA